MTPEDALQELMSQEAEQLQALLAEISTTGPALLRADEQELSVLLSSSEPGDLIEAAQTEEPQKT